MKKQRTFSLALQRRSFLAWMACSVAARAGDTSSSASKFFFVSRGKSGLAHADGSLVRYLEFDRPGQATWQLSGSMPDRRRVVLLSMEPRRDGPGKPFDEYYTQTPTHLWLFDLQTESLQEICTQNRLAPFMTPALILDEDRILVQVVKDKVGQIFSMKLDGSDARPFTAAGEGLPYGLSLSPDRQRVAFHLASPQGYQVWTSDVEGKHRTQLAAAPGHLYFGTNWSPDGQWVLYVDCHHEQDPGHDWADVCIGRADGSAHRVLTKEQAMWFAATYGDPQTRGGGSNVPSWTPDGKIIFPRRTAAAQVPWRYRVGQPDLDHFNRDFQPERARGGTQICELDPDTGQQKELTQYVEGQWDFRASASLDGKQIVFCSAKTGGPPTILTMHRDGTAVQTITDGVNHLGADHPRWF